MGDERMIFFKKLNTDGTLNMIGTQDTLPIDAVEITESEYTGLYRYIQENAVHIVDDVEESETVQ